MANTYRPSCANDGVTFDAGIRLITDLLGLIYYLEESDAAGSVRGYLVDSRAGGIAGATVIIRDSKQVITTAITDPTGFSPVPCSRCLDPRCELHGRSHRTPFSRHDNAGVSKIHVGREQHNVGQVRFSVRHRAARLGIIPAAEVKCGRLMENSGWRPRSFTGIGPSRPQRLVFLPYTLRGHWDSHKAPG